MKKSERRCPSCGKPSISDYPVSVNGVTKWGCCHKCFINSEGDWISFFDEHHNHKYPPKRYDNDEHTHPTCNMSHLLSTTSTKAEWFEYVEWEALAVALACLGFEGTIKEYKQAYKLFFGLNRFHEARKLFRGSKK